MSELSLNHMSHSAARSIVNSEEIDYDLGHKEDQPRLNNYFKIEYHYDMAMSMDKIIRMIESAGYRAREGSNNQGLATIYFSM